MTDAPADDPAALARHWLSTSTSGTLCTLSTAKDLDGFPFGSIVPYALDDKGRPLLLLAQIAEHARNAARDPRVSLFVAEQGRDGDPQAGWRINVAGLLTRLAVDDAVSADGLARYVARVPAASSYAATHDFFLWRLAPVRVRLIAGFGRIHWVDGADLLSQPGLRA